MIVRGLDGNGDWLYGKGIEDYRFANDAIAQSIQTRLLMFLNDCFFALDQGLDWFNLLGSKDQVSLTLAVNAQILNTPGVLALVQSSVSLDVNRRLSITYIATTSSSGANPPLAGSLAYLVSESGDFLTDESGNRLLL